MPTRHEKFVASIKYFCNYVLQCDNFKLGEESGVSVKQGTRGYSLELFEMEGKLSIPQFKEHFDNYFGEYKYYELGDLTRGVIITGDSELMFVKRHGALYVKNILVHYRNKQPMPFKVIGKKANVIADLENENQQLRDQIENAKKANLALLERKQQKERLLQNENKELREKIENANEANLILLERNQLQDRSLESYRKNMKDTESSITSLFDIVNELYRKNEEQKECPICFEDIEPNNLFVSKCKHYLCKRCAFLQHSNNCSICRDNWGEAISRYIEHIPPKRFTSGKVKAIVDYKAKRPKELSLKKGSIIEISKLSKKGKYCEGVELETGRRGLFIREHCEFLE